MNQSHQRKNHIPVPSPLNLSYQPNDLDDINTDQINYQTTFYSNLKPYPNICTICNFTIDEDLLELSCGHLSHRDCFIDNVLTCKSCSTDINDVSIGDEFQLLAPPIVSKEGLTPIYGPIDTPMTPSDQMIPDPLRVGQPIIKDPIPKFLTQQANVFNPGQNQLLSPRTSFNKNLNKDLFDSLMKPKIKFISENINQKHTLNDDNNQEKYNINYLISVKPPKFFNLINCDKNLILKNQIYDEIKFNILKNIVNWNDDGLIDFGSLGKLIIFEIIDISVDGTNWDQVRFFLFENCILLIDLKGETLIGQIHILNDISDMTRFASGLRLQLNNDTIPELQICTDIPLIISRLEYYFKKLLNSEFILETSVLQLTTNGWNLIKDNYSNLPVDAIRFQNCVENSLEIPESLLVQTMPSPEISPVNLILSVTLLNNSNMSNEEYKRHIIQLLDNIRKHMRPFDKLSLIFVGLNGSGVPCRKGSFIGGVEPNWSGWDSIYNEVKVQSNVRSLGKSTLSSGWDELKIALDKCKDLFPFLSSNIININKLIIISSNEYEPVILNNVNLLNMENQFKALLYGEKNLSIDFFRIGANYTPELEFGSKTVLQTSLINNDVLRIPYGSGLYRFDNFNDFSTNLIDILKNNYHQIVLPNITLDILKIIGTRDIVDLHKIEVNGKLIEINNFSNVKIILNNVTANSERNILLNMVVNLSKLKFDNVNYNDRIIDLPVLSYLPSWLNESADYTVLDVKLHLERQSGNVQFGDRSLTPPMNLGEETFPTPEVAPQTDRRYFKKATELKVIKYLKDLTQQTNPGFNFQSALAAIIDSIKHEKMCIEREDFNLYDDGTSELKKPIANSGKYSAAFNKNYITTSNYIDLVLNQLIKLSDLYPKDEFQAFVACKDFTNWLVQQTV